MINNTYTSYQLSGIKDLQSLSKTIVFDTHHHTCNTMSAALSKIDVRQYFYSYLVHVGSALRQQLVISFHLLLKTPFHLIL
jgi:hypothetical protein